MLLIHVVTKKPLLRQLSPDINTISDLILEVQKCGFRTGDLMMALDGNLGVCVFMYVYICLYVYVCNLTDYSCFFL